jgi:hypothetical protein
METAQGAPRAASRNEENPTKREPPPLAETWPSGPKRPSLCDKPVCRNEADNAGRVDRLQTPRQPERAAAADDLVEQARSDARCQRQPGLGFR